MINAKADGIGDALTTFQVDTDEIATIFQLYAAQMATEPEAEADADGLRSLWKRLQAAPRLAHLARIYAETRHPTPAAIEPSFARHRSRHFHRPIASPWPRIFLADTVPLCDR